MHGRVKVKTPAEQAEAKRQERLKKTKWYLDTMKQIFHKRDNAELDDELLRLTSDLLITNPDVVTVWNIRRCTLLHMKSSLGWTDELLSKDLLLTVACLKVNPKSYSVWHHRRWLMLNLQQPSWHAELQLCKQALSLDERNFHCWDYRRFVVKTASTTSDQRAQLLQNELMFSTEKITKNFSNYSAWHYRSSLLPEIFPGNTSCAVSAARLDEEFEYARTAMFTDPSDQSAYFYHRWLLGRANTPLDIRCAFVDRSHSRVVISLSLPIDMISGQASVAVDGEDELASWVVADQLQLSCSVVVCQMREDVFSPCGAHLISLQISHNNQTAIQVVQLEANEPTACQWLRLASPLSMFSMLAADPEVLVRELSSLEELLEINDEAENKWATLTTVQLLQALSPVANQEKIVKLLNSLVEIDQMRRGYYNSLRSQMAMQSALQAYWCNLSIPMEEKQRSLSVARLGLTSLSHLDTVPFLVELNVSHNSLTTLSGCQLLVCLRRLVADDNQITEVCIELSLLHMLEELSLRNNAIKDVCTLQHVPKSVNTLFLCGNPLKKNIASEVEQLLPSLQQLELT